MRVLVTGASGLLGTDIVLELIEKGHEVIKASFSERTTFIAADITQKAGIEKLASLDWDCIVHTSAAREPDVCEKDREEAYKLNVKASEELAKAAFLKKAKFIFISTDYVFSGDNPPYKESDKPSPINYYGQTKYEAEKCITSLCPDAIILRVSLLYGINAGIKASALLSSSLKALETKEDLFLDNKIIRYPLYTGDVARAISFLIIKKASGIFHLTSEDKLTKYQITKEIASITGRDSSHIKPLETVPLTLAKRPLNSHLDTNKISSLGLKISLPFHERLDSFRNKLVL